MIKFGKGSAKARFFLSLQKKDFQNLRLYLE
jgi:hypothetical protein